MNREPSRSAVNCSAVDRGRAMLERSAALGRKLGDNWALADGLKIVTVAWMFQDDYGNLAAPLVAFRGVAERLGNRFFIAWYHMTVGWAAVHRGDFARAEHALEIGLEYDRELGGAATSGFAVALLGEIEALTGRYEDAEARLVPFLGGGAATGDYLGAPWGVPTLARLLVGRGAPEEARDMIGPFVDLLRPLGVPYHVSDGLRVLGRRPSRRRRGRGRRGGPHRSQGAGRRHQQPLAGGTRQPPPRRTRPPPRRHGPRRRSPPRSAGAAGHRRPAPRGSRVDRGARRAGRRPGEFCRSSPSLRCRFGPTGRDGPGPLARGPARLRHRRRYRQRRPRRRCLQRRLGRRRRAQHRRGRRLRLPGPGRTQTPLDRLGEPHPTELDVVKLVAKGLTNPEIGERLFIGRGTVKTHLAHVFTKLGIASRSELAAEATRRPL